MLHSVFKDSGDFGLKTDWNCWLSIFALAPLSVWVIPSFFREVTPVGSCFACLSSVNGLLVPALFPVSGMSNMSEMDFSYDSLDFFFIRCLRSKNPSLSSFLEVFFHFLYRLSRLCISRPISALIRGCPSLVLACLVGMHCGILVLYDITDGLLLRRI